MRHRLLSSVLLAIAILFQAPTTTLVAQATTEEPDLLSPLAVVQAERALYDDTFLETPDFSVIRRNVILTLNRLERRLVWGIVQELDGSIAPDRICTSHGEHYLILLEEEDFFRAVWRRLDSTPRCVIVPELVEF